MVRYNDLLTSFSETITQICSQLNINITNSPSLPDPNDYFKGTPLNINNDQIDLLRNYCNERIPSFPGLPAGIMNA